jgi:hypothetical protein
MSTSEYWKSVGLSKEIHLAGTFIFNGIKQFHDLEYLDDAVEVFEVLYSLSVGIERLQKVAIILIEHNREKDLNKLLKSIRIHDVLELSDRIDKHISQNLSSPHRQLLSLLRKFYKSYRYGRYSLDSVQSLEPEKMELLEFLNKNLGKDKLGDFRIPSDQFDKTLYIGRYNDKRSKVFLGKILKKIVSGLFSIIQERAGAIGIYIDEIRPSSKAVKVFLGKRLDFIDEDIARKEALLFLMSDHNYTNTTLKKIKESQPLDGLDDDAVDICLKFLLTPNFLAEMCGLDCVEVQYYEFDVDIKQRLKLLKRIFPNDED